MNTAGFLIQEYLYQRIYKNVQAFTKRTYRGYQAGLNCIRILSRD